MQDLHNPEYDIIFAGGGTTACVVAGRLAAADPTLRILLLEQGPHTFDLEEHVQPGRFFTLMGPTSKVFSHYVSKPSEKLLNKPAIVSCGQCVGGGSSVNWMMYTRAAASDYDDWEKLYGNTGWSSKDLLPLLKKTETYQGQPGLPTHGYSGPLKVSYGGQLTNVGQSFLDVAEKYDKGRSYTEDANDLRSIDTYGRWLKDVDSKTSWIDGDSGKRSDAAHGFIYNQLHNKNLHVLAGRKVKRVLIENNRAVGVEFLVNPAVHTDADTRLHTVRATKLVVVSGGALGSPLILERSGIGAKSVLEKHGVKVVVDLPGVGENYQDHNRFGVPCFACPEADTLDAIFAGKTEEVEQLTAQMSKDGTGLMAHNSVDAGIKLRPNAEDLKELGPAFESRWREFYANAPDKGVAYFGPLASFFGDRSLVPESKYFSIGIISLYPMARGSVHIQSDDNVDEPPELHPGYLDNDADLAVIKWAYKRGREIARRMDLYRGELAIGHADFHPDSEAACKADKMPVAIDAPDINYTPEDNLALENSVRQLTGTSWHSLGTCAMKPREKTGVVDSRLNVYGVEGLKVADLSIAPENVGANTYSTALVIGEKAAVIIAEDLGIQGI